MAKINVLEKHIAELIAAGEVVERPASVVKELLENAIDAGAKQVTVSIESGGIRLIEISDNGTGIETEYISTAFVRHATSKIQQEDDLNCIATLGFRGEALASIASVARVEVLTKTEDDEFACSYRIEGGEELGLEVSARAVGTTIRVRDLFYNTPARMKFLKKDAQEGTYVADLVAHVALSNPEVSFKFVREGKLQYVTPGDGDLQSAAYAVLGREFARDLVKVSDASAPYTVLGYVSPPQNCRASRSMQYFYINGRYVKNRTMMAALETAYKGTLMHGKFPGCVLSMQMPYDMIDVNVHPAKTEVRFAREKDVFEAVYRAVKMALNQRGSETHSMQLSKPAQEARTQTEHTMPTTAFAQNLPAPSSAAPDFSAQALQNALSRVAQTSSTSEKPFAVVAADAPITSRVQMNSAFSDAPAIGLEREYYEQVGDIVGLQPAFASTKMSESVLGEIGLPEEDVLQSETTVQKEIVQEPVQKSALSLAEETMVAAEQITLYTEEEIDPLQYIGEIFKTYIVAQQGDALCLIDKHAAHERMLYETLAVTYGNVPSQMLLAPVTVTLSASEKQALLENIPLLENVGLEIDDFGATTVLVRAVPADVVVSDVEHLTVELAAKLSVGARDAISEKTEWVMHSISCRAAIKANDRTAVEELIYLAQRILSGEIPPYCPHGRPCLIKLTRKELEKQFGRIV